MERILAVTKAKREIADITGDVVDLIRDLNLRDGLCNLFVMHTTCALTIADLDPGTDLDMLDAFEAMVPKLKYRHEHDLGHTPDHIMAAIIGPSITIPVETGLLQMGSYQRIILVELSGPRNRDIVFSFTPENG